MTTTTDGDLIEGIPASWYHKRWWTLVVLNLSLVLVVMGNSSLNVAIPTLVEKIGASDTELQWIIDGYALVFGGLLLTMGAMGDRFGRRGALQLGLAIFGIAALWAALFAEKPWHIIASRSVMGLGAALVMPATLSILTTVFPPHERGKAIGIWAAFAGIGGIIGMLTSGWLLVSFEWQSIFWLNVPVVLLALVGGLLLVPTSKDEHQAPLDIVGSILSILALGLVLFAIIEGPNEGWASAIILGTGIVGAVFMALFILWERHTTHPMLPLDFFKRRRFNAGVIVITLTFFGMFSVFFLLVQYMQLVLGFTALEAAVRFLPLGLGMIAGAPNSDRLARKFGVRAIVVIGLVVIAGAMFSFTTFGVDTPYWRLGTTFFLMGIGMGFAMAPSTTIIMEAIPARKAGVGSSMNDTAREVGGAFGIAVLGSIAKDLYVSNVSDVIPATLPAPLRTLAESGLGGGLAAARTLGDPALVEAVKAAFVDAMGAAFVVAASLIVIAAVAVVFVLPRGVKMGAGHGAASVEEDAVMPATGAPNQAPPAAQAGSPGPVTADLSRPSRAPIAASSAERLEIHVHENTVFGVDPTTGESRWAHDAGAPLVTAPEVVDGTVRFGAPGDGSETLWVRLDHATGRVVSRLRIRSS